ncbi:MAG: porin family protein [Candidatus Cloacimonadota bacterium]|nr:porin family protein [Candidatus Cloacimonadota bacterium]
MKRISIIIVVMIFCASLLVAQGITGKGIKAGLNIATLTGDDVSDDMESIFRFAIGGFLTYSINEMFAIQPEVYYSMQGAKLEEGDEKTTCKYDYIQVPVLVKVNIPIESSLRPNIFLGPALGINLSAKYKYENAVEVEDDIEDVKTMDLGLVFGAGVNIGPATIDARYNLGLTTTDDSEDEFDVKNSVISIMLGYSF